MLPQGLKKFRINVFVSFLILLLTSITLLIVNFQSKNSFLTYLTSIQNNKNMRTYFASSRLSLMQIYGLDNIDEKNWKSLTINIKLNTKD